MSTSKRPTYFCTRPNGTLTPLIAMDDLPDHVHIHGVPRNITVAETHGMTSCGVSMARNEAWIIEDLNVLANRTYITQESLIELQRLLSIMITDPNTTPNLRAAAQSFIYRGIDPTIPIEGVSSSNNMVVALSNAPVSQSNDANGGNGSGSATGSGSGNGKHHNSKKEYCSYWIRHGECDYQQQGCLYKHEMPTDLAMLERLGLRDIPRWYREKFNVHSLLGQGGARAPNQSNEQQSNAKAIEYNPQSASQSPPQTTSQVITGDIVARAVTSVQKITNPQSALGAGMIQVSIAPPVAPVAPVAPVNSNQHHAPLYVHTGQRAVSGPAFASSSAAGPSQTYPDISYPDVDHLAKFDLLTDLDDDVHTTTYDHGPGHSNYGGYPGGANVSNTRFFNNDDHYTPTVSQPKHWEKRNWRGRARHLWDNETNSSNGGVQIKDTRPVDPFRSRPYYYRHRKVGASTDGAQSIGSPEPLEHLSSPISELVADSEPLDQNEVLHHWGLIGSRRQHLKRDSNATVTPGSSGYCLEDGSTGSK